MNRSLIRYPETHERPGETPAGCTPVAILPRLHLIAGVILAIALTGCAGRSPQPQAEVGGCVHTHELPPLKLTSEHKRLLDASSTPPKTALDFYMLLPKSYFSIMPDSRERRVTYIDTSTLSADYLHASRYFECDGGGFEVSVRLYRTSTRTFVALKSGNTETIFDDGKPREGEPSVHIERASLWLYTAGDWVRQPDQTIPKISAQRVLAKYHHEWDADRQYTDQEKFIWIDYVLSPVTDDIVLRGRENFQPEVYEYARLRWRDGYFSFN